MVLVTPFLSGAPPPKKNPGSAPAFSVQVKVLRYNFSTGNYQENRSSRVTVERTKSWRNLEAQRKSSAKNAEIEKGTKSLTKLTLSTACVTLQVTLLSDNTSESFACVTLPWPCSKAGNTSSSIQHGVSTSSSPSLIKLK